MGLLPTYASIGVAAPILLLVMRMLQGAAIGGESSPCLACSPNRQCAQPIPLPAQNQLLLSDHTTEDAVPSTRVCGVGENQKLMASLAIKLRQAGYKDISVTVSYY